MHKLAALAFLFASNAVFAGQINCYGADYSGKFYQILDITNPKSTRIIIAVAAQEPGTVTVVSDESYQFLLDGYEQVELETGAKLGTDPTTVTLHPAYSARRASTEGLATMEVVVAKPDDKKNTYAFPGKFSETVSGEITTPFALSCTEL